MSAVVMDVQKAPLHTPSLEEVAKGDVIFSFISLFFYQYRLRKYVGTIISPTKCGECRSPGKAFTGIIGV